MCEKQLGNFFGAFADVAPGRPTITRGEPGGFQSSEEALRGDCGTPLFYTFLSRHRLAVSIGSLGRHSEVRPQFQYGIAAREPWFAGPPFLPGTLSGEGDNGAGDTPERFEKIRLSTPQHPDHATAHWPPR